MSIQILGYRPYLDSNTIKIKQEFFPVKAKSVTSLFQNLDKILSRIPKEEHYNLHYTVNHVKDRDRKQFLSAEVVAFDIDDIDYSKKEEYLPVIGRVLNVNLDKCPVVFSGNGIHIIIKLRNTINDEYFFKKGKGSYKYWCDQINLSLKESQLPGLADPAVFGASRTLRLPLTKNIKPAKYSNQQINHSVGAGDVSVQIKDAELYQKELEYCGFDFDITPDFLDFDDDEERKPLKEYPPADTAAVVAGCDFIKYAKENQAKMKEPEWYAAIGITAWLPDPKISHDISKDHPNYDYEETETKVQQAKSMSGPRTCEGIKDLWSGCLSCPNYQKVKTPLQIKTENKEDITHGFTRYSETGAVIREYDRLRKYFDKIYKYVFIQENERLYIYDGGRYILRPKAWVKQFAQAHFVPTSERETERKEFYGIIAATNGKSMEFFDQASSRGLINLCNGVLSVQDRVLMPHSPEYGFQYTLPYGFDGQNERCPTWDLLLKTITKGRQHLVNTLEEFLGYILLNGEYVFNNILILSGGGSNGKTSLINCMKLVIGEGNCSAVTVSSLSRQFSSAGLEGKLANFSEEEPISCFKETGELKKITGNSPVFVENKFEKGYTMVNRAKIIMSYNKVPYLGDTSYGMRRRLLIVPCDHNYEELPETKIKDLYTKIQEELPAILNRALTALERLQRRGGFLEVEETASIVTEMVHDSDAVQEWFDYYIVPDTENNICFKDAYNNFKNEMELGKDSKLISFRGFCKRLRDICREKKIEIDARKKIIKGYSLNEPEEEF